MHIFGKYITDSSLKMTCVGILSSTLYALCIETKIHFVNQNKGKITYNLAMGQSKFSYELTFLLILIKNSGKPKSKNTLRVVINQFYDGKRDTIRSSYAIDKMGGVKLPHLLLEK